MSYQISKKKRSKNFVTPRVFLLAGMAPAIQIAATQAVSADTVEHGAVQSSGNTITGWDSQGSGTMSDATGTLSDATTDITQSAHDRQDSVTSAAPEVSGSTATGWVDVYVDHTNVDDAIVDATKQGINLTHGKTVIQTGDAEQTAKNNDAAVKYYKDKAQEIKDVAAKYTTDMNNWRAEVARNKQDAADANAQMDALKSNLAAQGQTVNLTSKAYSKDGLTKDTAAIKKSIEDGRKLIDAKIALADAQRQVDAMTIFQSESARGNIKLETKTVSIGSKADADKYLKEQEEQRTKLEEYINSLEDITGSIPEDARPTFTQYSFVLDKDVEAAGTAVVEVFNYRPIEVAEPEKPTVEYHFFDIRSTPTSNSGWENTDNETILNEKNDNANGNVVAQAMVNQTVGIATDHQPIPSERFDKIHNLSIITKLPTDVEFNEEKSNADPENWIVSYDKTTNTVTQTATSAYLVKLNLKQNNNESGTVGGTVHDEWQYDAPDIFFKLMKDNKTYQAVSTTIINDEYMFQGEGIQIRVDQADPSKVNTNSLYQNIDGKAVLPGSINNYVLGWDFDQYKNVNIDSEMQKKGLVLVDDFPEEAVSVTGPISIIDPTTNEVLYSAAVPSGAKTGDSGQFQSVGGEDIEGLTWEIVDEKSAPEGLKKPKLDEKGEPVLDEDGNPVFESAIKGQAIVVRYTGVDGDFYKKYVEQGKSLAVVLPMTTLKIDNTPDEQGGTYNGNEYSNVAYQSDFGNTYKSNTVENHAPLLDPKKDAVLSFSDLTSLDINNNETAEVENGTYFQYSLKGSELPNNLSESIKSYVFTDDMDTANDRYDGEFIVQTNNDIHFLAGSTLAQRYPNGIKAGSDISKYFTQTIERDDAKTNISHIAISADKDFLAQIDYEQTNFYVNAFVSTKRIANTDGVENVFNEVINGIDFGSNKVVTNSKANALDDLRDQLNSLQSSASAGISSNASDIESMAGALSIIVQSIDSVSSNVDSVASQAQSYFDYTNEEISLVASSASSAVDSIASSASSAVSSNSAAIDSVASSTTSATSSVASFANSAIASLAAKLAGATEQVISTMTIYDATVTTDAEALQYAVDRGIAPGSIKSIELNKDKKFVVSYNTSKTAINNSKNATTGATNSKEVAKSTLKFQFYTLSTTKDVYARLAKMGYPKETVTSVTNNNGVFTALVRVSTEEAKKAVKA